MHAVVGGIDALPAEGDFDGLRRAMSCLYDLKNNAEAIEYELDSLAEIAAYLEADEPGGAAGAEVRRVRVRVGV